MPTNMLPTSTIKMQLGIEPNGLVQRYAVHRCRVHMDKYLPFDKGTLARTVTETPHSVIYNQEYAIIVYKGLRNGKKIEIKPYKHPLATSYWDKEMWTAEGEQVIKEIQKFIKR